MRIEAERWRTADRSQILRIEVTDFDMRSMSGDDLAAIQLATGLLWDVAMRNGQTEATACAGFYEGTAEEIDTAPERLPRTTS